MRDPPISSDRLVRSLGLTQAVLYGLGVTIGAGIYVLVGLAAGRAGGHAPVAATLAGVCAILALALAVPLAGLADLAAIGTLIIFIVINIALVVIKKREALPPPGVFVCPLWVPAVGALASAGLLAADIWGRV